MARFERKYFKTVHRNTGGFLPTFPPGKPINLGDLIDIKNKRMDIKGNILKFSNDIQVEEELDNTADDTIWQSESDIEVGLKAKGDAPGPGSKLPVDKAGLTVSFRKKGSFLLHTMGVRFNRIGNLPAVRRAVKRIAASEVGMRRIFLGTS